MEYFKSDYFTYKNNELFCENVQLSRITDEVGTPVFIYSKNYFAGNYKKFNAAFKDIPHTIYYACKANFNLNVIKIFNDMGAGIDVNSAGEFYRAEKAGVLPGRMLLSGVGKTRDEIKLGIEKDIFLIKAESYGEIELINKIAGDLGKTASVAIRVNPDVDPKTHPYISTGLAENKFGVPAADASKMFKEVSKMSNIKLTGIDMHIGSQIKEISPYEDAVSRMGELFHELNSMGIKLKHFDIGGGMGITYKNEVPFVPGELAAAIVPILKPLNCRVFFEPGRFLTANGGVLLTEVLYTKNNGHKNFIVVDAAMTEILRPSIYKAYHHVQPVTKSNRNDITADIVGPVCESGDFLAKGRDVPECGKGDLLAVMSAGAYGMVMSSNYNGRRRPPEVIVDGNNFYVTRGRETFEHLLYDEKILDELHK